MEVTHIADDWLLEAIRNRPMDPWTPREHTRIVPNLPPDYQLTIIHDEDWDPDLDPNSLYARGLE